MTGKVWFGTKGNMQWIPAPAVNMGAGKTGYAGRADFLNGGAWVRRSKAAAKSYNMSWNLQRREDIQPVLDYADGMYGNGPIYFLDPFAADRNVLPAYWAAPYINTYDGPIRTESGARPERVDNGTSINGYPVESAKFSGGSLLGGRSVYIPIPPTSIAHVGAHGDALTSTGAGVQVVAHATISGGPVTMLPFLSRATQQRTSHQFAGSLYHGVTISIAPGTGGDFIIDGIIAQVLPAGVVPAPGGFISGQGNSGLSFVSQPSVTAYSAAMDRVGVSADLVETEAWR